MNTNQILLLLLVIVIGYYIYNTKYRNKFENTVENFQINCTTNDIERTAIQTNFKDTKLACLLDYMDPKCKLLVNQKYPLSIIRTINKDFLSVFNDGLLYINSDIESETLWRGPLINSSPKDNVKLKMVTYDKTGKLLGVGTDGFIYIKTSDDIESPWNVTPVPNSGCVIYIIYDKDSKLLGLNQQGKIIKKKTEEITSEWEPVSDKYPKPLLKLYWDMNDHMLGIGLDFKLYQRKLPTWEVSEWKDKMSTDKLFDIIYDKDGRLYGLVLDDINNMIELRKQNTAYYYSSFYPLDDINTQGIDKLMDANIIKSKVGIDFVNPFNSNNESLNNIMDPSAQELQELHSLENQNKLRQFCASKKKKYNSTDYYDFELQRKMEEQNNMISNLKLELNEYSKSDKKYGKMTERSIIPHDIIDLIPVSSNNITT